MSEQDPACGSRLDAPYLGLVEPVALLEQFIAHPPDGFAAERSPSGMPTFVAPFDLLTTADDALRRQVSRLPLYRRWHGALRWRTRFLGSTVTEYAPLPRDASPDALADEVLEHYGGDAALLIAKDLALDSPLLDAVANRRVRAFAKRCEARGFVLLDGMDLAWVPIDFTSTQDYLARLSSSRRKDIRRKLRARERLEIEAVPTGDPRFSDPAVLAEHYALYLEVYRQSEIHFDKLSKAFFRSVLGDASSGGVVFTYRLAGRLIGWNLCYEHAGRLVDKYVGFRYPQAREQNLYFVSWMYNLEHALARGLSHYVAGWTDAPIKRYLGARTTKTQHAVYARNPVLRAVLRRLAPLFEGEAADAPGAP